MPTPHRADRSGGAEKTLAMGPNSRIGKRTGSTLSNDKSRKKIRKAPDAATGIASTLREGVRSSQEGLPPSNQPSNPPVPAVGVTSNSLRGGRIHNHSSPPSTATSNRSFPAPSQSSELGSVASFTGRAGPRSALRSGSLELASVLEAAKRLLERYCYKVSPFIVPGEDMIDIITKLWPEANRQKGFDIDFNLSQVYNLRYIKNAYHSMQSSWIFTARNNIADLFDLNAHSSATERLAAVNALLLDYTFIYRDSDRELPPARRITPFFASQIPRFIHLHFFNKHRVQHPGLYNWLLDEQPPTLIIYVVTALHHALQEWRKSGGVPPSGPAPQRAHRQTGGWTYFFNFKNDGASYGAFMSLWSGLHPRLREKAVNSIRHTLKAEILSRATADESTPVVEPAPTLELDPDLLEAFLDEPDPEEIDLGPLVGPHRSDSHRIGVENGMDNENVFVRTDVLGGSQGDDPNSTAEHSLDDTTDFEDDIVDDQDDGMVEDEVEYIDLAEADDDCT